MVTGGWLCTDPTVATLEKLSEGTLVCDSRNLDSRSSSILQDVLCGLGEVTYLSPNLSFPIWKMKQLHQEISHLRSQL